MTLPLADHTSTSLSAGIGSTRVVLSVKVRGTGANTTTQLTAATVAEKYRYFPFGAVAAQTGSGSDYLFTGQERDEETGLHNYRARMMSGTDELGRFFSMDPQHQTHSPYTYAGNNPISNIDPDGELFWVLPSVGWSYRDGFSVGLTAGVGTPGPFGYGASVNVSYNLADSQTSWSTGVYAGMACVNYGPGGLSGGLGFNQNQSGFGVNVVGVNHHAKGGTTVSLLGWEYNKRFGLRFNASVSFSERFEWGEGATPSQTQLFLQERIAALFRTEDDRTLQTLQAQLVASALQTAALQAAFDAKLATLYQQSGLIVPKVAPEAAVKFGVRHRQESIAPNSANGGAPSPKVVGASSVKERAHDKSLQRTPIFLAISSTVVGLQGEMIEAAIPASESTSDYGRVKNEVKALGKSTTKFLRGLKYAGMGLGILGLGYTAADANKKGWQNSHYADLAIGAITTFIWTSPSGWVAGGGYLLVDIYYQQTYNKFVTQYYLD